MGTISKSIFIFCLSILIFCLFACSKSADDNNKEDVIYNEIPANGLCISCHGIYPHTKDKKASAITNMHLRFMVCEACHIREKKGEEIYYAWLDVNTGKKVKKPKEVSTAKGVRIIPIERKGDTEIRLDQLVDEESARKFIKDKRYWVDDRSKIRTIFHERQTRGPISCVECHVKVKARKIKSEYEFPYEELGYSAERIKELTTGEIAKIADEYYEPLPTMFDHVLEKKRKLKP